MDQAVLSRSFRLLKRRYGMRARGIQPCRSLYKKEAAYRVQTDDGTLLFKPFDGKRERLTRVSSLMDKLKRHHFAYMPQWISTSRGKRWIKSRGRLYYVTQWIDGPQLGDSLTDYERLGTALARLHGISRRRSQKSCTKVEINRFKREHRRFARMLRKCSSNKAGAPWYREKGDECLALAEKAWRTLGKADIRRALRKEKSALIHGDVTRPNVIVSGDGLRLVDWDTVKRGSAYYEIAKTLNNTARYSTPHMQALLTAYEKYRPLSPSERLIVSSLFRLPREAWQATGTKRAKKAAALLHILQVTWPQRLEAVKWMDAWARQP